MEALKTEKSLWQEKLQEYKTLFLNEKQEQVSNLKLIDNTLKLLQERISFAFIGPVKAGKSTVINAILGKSFLTAEVTACTFFATKIRPCSGDSLKFYAENCPEQVLNNFQDIKKKVKELNDNHRLQKRNTNEKVWILEAPCIGLSKGELSDKLKDILPFIEIIDLPGISDDVYQKKNSENSNEEAFENQFNEMIKVIDIDALTVVFDITQSHEMEKFARYFRMNLFKGANRFKLYSAFERKSVIKIVNKFDVPKDEEKEEAKQKIQDMIFRKFDCVLNKKNINFLQKFGIFFSKNSELYDVEVISQQEYNTRFNKFMKDSRFSFVSAGQALKSIEINTEDLEAFKKMLTKAKKSPAEIDQSLATYKKTLVEESKYDSDTNFESFINSLIEVSQIVYQNKFKNILMKNLAYLEVEKQDFLRK